MSTRAVIARPTAAGWEGTYHHSDGYPTGLGVRLHNIHREVFKGDTEAMRRFVIDEHPEGWSHIGDGDPKSPHGIGKISYENPYDRATDPEQHDAYYTRFCERPSCFCHDENGKLKKGVEPELHTHDDYGSDIEWVYVLGADGLDVYQNDGGLQHRGIMPWGMETTGRDWTAVECGEDYERCTCYATTHFNNVPEAYKSLTGAMLLGHRKVADADAPSYQLPDGRIIRPTGSGSYDGIRYTGTAIFPDGSRVELPLYYTDGSGENKLCDGMVPVHAPIFTAAELGEKEPRPAR